MTRGRVGKPTGLSQAEPVSRLGPAGFDPSRMGVCAYDLDECTVTLALDSADAVRALVAALPPKSRVSLCYDKPTDRVRCVACGRFLTFAELCFSKLNYTPLNEFGPEEVEWLGPCCRYRDTDGSPQGGDREDGLHREATTAGAEGIAQPQTPTEDTP